MNGYSFGPASFAKWAVNEWDGVFGDWARRKVDEMPHAKKSLWLMDNAPGFTEAREAFNAEMIRRRDEARA